jgi:hypothetical protein
MNARYGEVEVPGETPETGRNGRRFNHEVREPHEGKALNRLLFLVAFRVLFVSRPCFLGIEKIDERKLT